MFGVLKAKSLRFAPLAAVLVGCAGAAMAGDEIKRVKLDNGAIVLVRPVADVNQVAVIAAYDTGFADEPAGMTQAAHLAEHLRCFGGDPGAFEKLNVVGQANAETLPTFTYFDFSGPADQLGEALRVEAARLRNVAPKGDLILQEAPRCYAETNAVEQSGAGGMIKHAFMVYYQAWNYGRQIGLVRGGLESFTPDAMRDYIRANFTTDHLILVIFGGVDADQAIALAREHFGGIEAAKHPPRAMTNWSKVSRESTVNWDATPSAVCIAYEPPDQLESRVILSLFGAIAGGSMHGDAALDASADALVLSAQTWPVGRLPFFAYATTKRGAPLDSLREALQKRLDEVIDSRSAAAGVQIRMVLTQLLKTQPIDQATIKQAARALPAKTQNSPDQATRMVLGNAALQTALREYLFNGDVEGCAGRIMKMSPDEIQKTIRNALTPERRFVTFLLPK